MTGSPPISGRKVDTMRFTVKGKGNDKAVFVELSERDVKRKITPDDLYRLFMPVNVDVYKYEYGVKIPVIFVGQVELVKKLYGIGKKFGFLPSTEEDIKKAQEHCEFYLDELRELDYNTEEIEKKIAGFKYDRAYAVLCYHKAWVRTLISRLVEVTRAERMQDAMSELYKYATRYRDLAEGTSEPWAYERHVYEADTVISALAHAKTEGGFNALDFAGRMEYQATEAEDIFEELQSDAQTWKSRVSLAEDFLASETPKDEANVSHETYVDTDSVHKPERVKLGAKWSRPVIEDAALNYGFDPGDISEFIRLFEDEFELETGWCYDSDTAEATLYGYCSVKLTDFITTEEMGNSLWDMCFDAAAEQLENQLGERDDESQPTPEAEEVAERIRENAGWDLNDCAELCHLAGLDIEWEEADGSEFESVVYAAAEKLGVEI